MRGPRWLVVASVLAAASAAAFGQDESVLSGRDDVAFAERLLDGGYADLAVRLVSVVERTAPNPAGSQARLRRVRLECAQDEALRIEDAARREEALAELLFEKELFLADFAGTPSAESVRASLPALQRRMLDGPFATIRPPRTADAMFQCIEALFRNRISVLEQVDDPTPLEAGRLEAVRYNLARALYHHALTFPREARRRRELVEQALVQFDEFDMEYGGSDGSILSFQAYIDVALCLADMGGLDDACKSLDRTIELRESWGRRDATGRFPLGDGPPEVADLVSDATVRKVALLLDGKRFGDAFRTAMDYFESMPQPFEAPSSIRLLSVLGRPLIDGSAVLGHGDVERLVAACTKAFAGRPVLTEDRRRLDEDLVRAEPDLAWAYLTRGVAERMAARVDHDQSRLAHCRDVIFVPLVNTFYAEKPPELWWAAKYHHISTMVDRGEWRDAKLMQDDVQRRFPETGVDGSFGWRERIVRIKLR